MFEKERSNYSPIYNGVKYALQERVKRRGGALLDKGGEKECKLLLILWDKVEWEDI